MKFFFYFFIFFSNIIVSQTNESFIKHPYFTLSHDGKYIYTFQKANHADYTDIVKIDVETGAVLHKSAENILELGRYVDDWSKPIYNKQLINISDDDSLLYVTEFFGELFIFNTSDLSLIKKTNKNSLHVRDLQGTCLFNNTEYRRIYLSSGWSKLDKINLDGKESTTTDLLYSFEAYWAISSKLNYAIIAEDQKFKIYNLNTLELSDLNIPITSKPVYIDDNASYLLTINSLIRLSDNKILMEFDAKINEDINKYYSYSNLFFIDDNRFIIDNSLVEFNPETDSILITELNNWKPIYSDIYSPVQMNGDFIYQSYGYRGHRNCGDMPTHEIGPVGIKGFNFIDSNYIFSIPEFLVGKNKKMKFSPNGNLGVREAEFTILQELDTEEVVKIFRPADDFCFPKNDRIVFFRKDSATVYNIQTNTNEFLFTTSATWSDNFYYEDKIYLYNDSQALSLNLDKKKIDTLFTSDSTIHKVRALHGKLEIYFKTGVHLYDINTQKVETIIAIDPPSGFCNSISQNREFLIFIPNILKDFSSSLPNSYLYSLSFQNSTQLKLRYQDCFFISDNLLFAEYSNPQGSGDMLSLNFLQFPEEEPLCYGLTIYNHNEGYGYYYEEKEILYKNDIPMKFFGYHCYDDIFFDVCKEIKNFLSVESTQIFGELIQDNELIKFAKPTKFKIYNLNGFEIYNEKSKVTSFNLKTLNLSHGIYFIKYENQIKKILVAIR